MLKLKLQDDEEKKVSADLKEESTNKKNNLDNSNISYNDIQEDNQLIFVHSNSKKIPRRESNKIQTDHSKQNWKYVADKLKQTNEIINESLIIYTATWNLKGQIATQNEVRLLLSREDKNGNQNSKINDKKYSTPHLYVIGTQECMRSILKSFFNDNKDDWIKMLQSELGEDYVLIKAETLSAMNLCMFAHISIGNQIKNVVSGSIRTGIGNMVGNKGAVCIAFLFKEKYFLFINSHLAAGHSGTENRNKDFFRINTKLSLPYPMENKSGREEVTISDKFDVTFWLGDFNYRINLEPHQALNYIKNQEIDSLVEHDQLLREASLNRLKINNFSEGYINFYPTYKLISGLTPGQTLSDSYDLSERTPSYTDRILFKCKNNGLTQHKYDSIISTHSSDHKPVYSIFRYDFIEKNKSENTNQMKSKFCNIY